MEIDDRGVYRLILRRELVILLYTQYSRRVLEDIPFETNRRRKDVKTRGHSRLSVLKNKVLPHTGSKEISHISPCRPHALVFVPAAYCTEARQSHYFLSSKAWYSRFMGLSLAT